MNKEQNNIERNSSFELLRILAIIMIVASHFSAHGEFSFPLGISINKGFMQLLSLGGKIGVNIFVLISGYFLIVSDSFKLKKLVKLWFQIFFYSFSIYLIFLFIGGYPFKLDEFISSCFPIISNKYWFAGIYVILYLYIPYINKFLFSLDKNTYKKLLLTMFFCWSLIPTLTAQPMYGTDLIWFLFLYCFAAYIRLYFNNKETSKKYFLFAVVVCVLTFLSTIIFDGMGEYLNDMNFYATYLYGKEKIPIFLISLFLFLGFKNLDIKKSKVINVLASATFGVYLIHDNELVRDFLWNNFFKNSTYANSNLLMPYALCSIFIVYLGCTVIELIRVAILEKPFMRFLDKHEYKFENSKNRILKKLKIE